MNPEDDLEKHVGILTGHVDFAFTYVTTFRDLCPASLREIYHALYHGALERFPEDSDAKFTAVSGFLFLRYFVPALLVLFLAANHNRRDTRSPTSLPLLSLPSRPTASLPSPYAY